VAARHRSVPHTRQWPLKIGPGILAASPALVPPSTVSKSHCNDDNTPRSVLTPKAFSRPQPFDCYLAHRQLKLVFTGISCVLPSLVSTVACHEPLPLATFGELLASVEYFIPRFFGKTLSPQRGDYLSASSHGITLAHQFHGRHICTHGAGRRRRISMPIAPRTP